MDVLSLNCRKKRVRCFLCLLEVSSSMNALKRDQLFLPLFVCVKRKGNEGGKRKIQNKHTHSTIKDDAKDD